MSDQQQPATIPKFWTDERAQRCRELWAQGLSAAAIAAEIGAPSRNSVLSKIHRSGWQGRNSSDGPASGSGSVRIPRRNHVRRRQVPAAAAPPRELPPVALDPAVHGTAAAIANASFAAGGPKTLLALGRADCKWPLGTPGAPDFAFCAAPRADAIGPYCAHHADIASDKARARRPFVPSPGRAV